MRYPASEKAEIIQLVEQSHLPANHRKPPLAASAAGRLNSNPDEPEPPLSKRLISLKSSADGQFWTELAVLAIRCTFTEQSRWRRLPVSRRSK